MLFHVSILAFSAFFFGLLEVIVAISSWSFVLAFFSLVALFIFLWRFGGSFTSAVVPTLFSISTVILLFFVSSPRQRHIFIFLSSLVFYVAVLGVYRLRYSVKDLTARGMLSLVSMVTLFFFFGVFHGLFLNFQRFDEFTLMISYGLGTFLVSLSVFSHWFPSNFRRVRLYSWFLGMFLAEIAWMSVFWPFGYLTAGAISLLLLSVPWDMLCFSSSGPVSFRRIVAHLMLMFFLLGMVLLSSVWLPVV